MYQVKKGVNKTEQGWANFGKNENDEKAPQPASTENDRTKQLLWKLNPTPSWTKKNDGTMPVHGMDVLWFE